MKKLVLCGLAAACFGTASAQRTYFVYLQTDDQTPFYVRMSDKIYSSAASGYLILPNLLDSTYNLSVGFPRVTQPETRFAVTVNHGDKGYLLKNFHDGLSLFDMQTLGLIKAVSAAADDTVYETRSDNFSSTLSKAANDPSLLKVPVVKKEEPKTETKTEAMTKTEESTPVPPPIIDIPTKTADTAAPKQETAVLNPIERKDTVATQVVEAAEPTKQNVTVTEAPASVVEYKRTTVTRRSESSTTEGLGIVYFDKGPEVTDTIRILIPPSKIRMDEEAPAVSLSEIEKREKSIAEVSEPPKVDIASVPRTNEVSINAACRNNATEKDFMRLRKNMAAKASDEEMIAEARKSFKGRCYTVEQIRYLSTLFLTSAAKYQFFDAAYNHVSDTAAFASLQSEIKDDYYLKRFKALVGE